MSLSRASNFRRYRAFYTNNRDLQLSYYDRVKPTACSLFLSHSSRCASYLPLGGCFDLAFVELLCRHAKNGAIRRISRRANKKRDRQRVYTTRDPLDFVLFARASMRSLIARGVYREKQNRKLNPFFFSFFFPPDARTLTDRAFPRRTR